MSVEPREWITKCADCKRPYGEEHRTEQAAHDFIANVGAICSDCELAEAHNFRR